MTDGGQQKHDAEHSQTLSSDVLVDDQTTVVGDEPIKTFRVLLTGFGPFANHIVNPSWLAVKALNDVTITSDQWQEVYGNIVVTTPTNTTSPNANSKGLSSSATAGSPSGTNGKRSVAGLNGASEGAHATNASVASSSSGSSTSPPPKGHASKAKSSSVASSSTMTNLVPLPSLPEPGPYNIHITAIQIPVIYESVLETVPSLHFKPPQLPADVLEGTPGPPEQGYDFIFHVGVAGRGALRMEIIGHKYGYNMKDSSGQYCAVVPPPSASKNPINNNRGPGSGGPPGVIQPPYTGGFVHGSGFGSMGMGYNNERLGYNPAVHDPQPGLPGSDNTVRPMRGFGTAYETFPDEMATDIDVTRLVQDLKASGVNTIYTSMDAGHYLCDYLYYCSLAESKRSSKALLPFLTNTSYVAPSPHYGPAYGPHYSMHHFPGPSTANTGSEHVDPPHKAHGQAQGNGNGNHLKPARVLFMHCPPVNEPLSTEEVTETIRRIVLWVGREMQIMEMREKAAQEPDEGVATGFN
ncbi:hypothetical protein EST38_g1008 [Candolleomyces aberdarensis]|uniref:Uncharacterized protein n=1 Tax=Candolleomyces aberdarensis TaxID=2316362 RepID=A0A4Q2DX68_9AGAR|nr:hypothetical protein EST38_g1008 [Candolleomyces aberdarensis]